MSGEQEQIVTPVEGIKIQQVKTASLEQGAGRERIRLMSLPEDWRPQAQRNFVEELMKGLFAARLGDTKKKKVKIPAASACCILTH